MKRTSEKGGGESDRESEGPRSTSFDGGGTSMTDERRKNGGLPEVDDFPHPHFPHLSHPLPPPSPPLEPGKHFSRCRGYGNCGGGSCSATHTYMCTCTREEPDEARGAFHPERREPSRVEAALVAVRVQRVGPPVQRRGT